MIIPITFKEYEQKSLEEINKPQKDENPCEFKEKLSGENLKKIEKYLEKIGHSSALKIGYNSIKAYSFVGVIKYKNIQIEILPKLISDTDNNKAEIDEKEKKRILNNLIFMLSYTKKLDIKTSDSAKLSQSSHSFLEILIREYADSLYDCLKRLTPRSYIRKEENLNFLKGKLKFSENIRYNNANQAKFYCEYDEFGEDCVLNQLFYYVANCLYSISKDSKNKSKLKLITDYFCDVKLIRFDSYKCEKIKLSRNQKMFEKTFKLAKMFVEHSSVDLSRNKFENITLLWDMNKLFEEFIYQLMRKHIKLKEISAQKQKRLLINNEAARRDTRIDIFVTRNDKKQIIIDTKYKKFEKFDDISSSDMYQVFTYCLLHDTPEISESKEIEPAIERAVLLYPKFPFFFITPAFYP